MALAQNQRYLCKHYNGMNFYLKAFFFRPLKYTCQSGNFIRKICNLATTKTQIKPKFRWSENVTLTYANVMISFMKPTYLSAKPK